MVFSVEFVVPQANCRTPSDVSERKRNWSAGSVFHGSVCDVCRPMIGRFLSTSSHLKRDDSHRRLPDVIVKGDRIVELFAH